MNQAGMILALILWSIPAEMVKRSKPSKRSKSSKPIKSSQYNTVQYSTVQYSPIQSNTITREYRTKVRPCPPGSLGEREKPSPAWRGWHGEAVTGVEGTHNDKKQARMNETTQRSHSS